MSYQVVKLRWKVLSVLEMETAFHRNNILFNLSPNTGLYSQFSIPLWHCYVPHILSPTNTYHQVIRNLFRTRFGIDIKDKRFPYRIFCPNLGAEIQLNIEFRLFFPNILSLTVKISDIPTDLDPTRLIEYQALDYLRPVSDIVQWTIGLVKTLDHKNFVQSQPLRYKPAIHLDGICSPEKFHNHVNDNSSKYIGILIRNHDYELMDKQITNIIFEKNKEHNLKSSQELLLLDKQGILYLTPQKSGQSKPKPPRFSRTYDLYEIALVFSEFINIYFSVRMENEDFADFILFKIKPWIEEPDLIFSKSVSNKHVWCLALEELRLKPRLDYVLGHVTLNAKTDNRNNFFNQFSTDWWNEKDFPELLSKKIRESNDLNFNFLDNEDLKELILQDHNEAKRSFHARNYKATIILCGSIIEAILTASIDKQELPGLSTKKLYTDYDLNKLIVLAKEIDLIKDKNIYSLLDPLRNYRNTIHAGVQIRKSLTPDSSKAQIALETVHLLIKDLSNNSKKEH